MYRTEYANRKPQGYFTQNVQKMDNILRKTTSLAWTDLPYGPQVHTTASTVLAGTTRSTKSELEEHSQQRPTKEGVHLGGSRGNSSLVQTWMLSECGPMCPVGYGMNQGQGQECRKWSK